MTDTPFFAAPTDAGWTDLGNGVRRRVKLTLPEMMMVEFEFEAGAIGALHSHPHLQCSYVEDGAFDVTIDGATERLDKGGAYIVPSGKVHGVKALSPGRLVDVFSPRRDDFL